MSSSRVPGRRPYQRRINESRSGSATRFGGGARPLSNLLSQFQDFSIDGDESGANENSFSPTNGTTGSVNNNSALNTTNSGSGYSGSRRRQQQLQQTQNPPANTPMIPEEESGATGEDEGWLFNDPDGAGALADLLSKSKKNRTDGRSVPVSRRRRGVGGSPSIAESGRTPSNAASDLKQDQMSDTVLSPENEINRPRFEGGPTAAGRNSPAPFLSSTSSNGGGPPNGIPTRTHGPNAISRSAGGSRINAPSPSRSIPDTASVKSGGYVPSPKPRSISRSRDAPSRTNTPRLQSSESIEGGPAYGFGGGMIISDRPPTRSPTTSPKHQNTIQNDQSDYELYENEEVGILQRGLNNRRPSASRSPFIPPTAPSPRMNHEKWTQAISQFKITPLFSASETSRYGAKGMIRRGSAQTTQSALSGIVDLSDTATVTRLVDDAMMDCEGFNALDPEKYNEMKRELVSLTTQVASLQNKIGLETKMRDSAESMLQLNPTDSPRAKRQISEADSKIEEMAANMWKALFKLIQTERTVFQHIGGILRWQIDELQNQFSSAPTIKVTPKSEDLQQKLQASESRVRELENQIFVLQSNVSRLEAEQEPIRRIAGDYQKEARRAREDRDAYETRVKSTEPSKANVIEINRLKLELASSRAELSSLTEELGATRDSLAALQLQLQEDQSVIEEKDRTIANLLADLEEKDNQLEMIQAGAHVPYDTLSRNTGSLSRMMKQKRETDGSNSDKNRAAMLAAQLKEAVLEREKLKFDLEQERERAVELGAQLGELRSVSSHKNFSSSNKNGYSRRPPGSSTAGPRSGSDTETEGEDQTSGSFRFDGGGSINGRGKPSQSSRQQSQRRSSSTAEHDRQRIMELEQRVAELREKALSEQDEAIMRDLYEGMYNALQHQNDSRLYQRRRPTFSISSFLAKAEELLNRIMELEEEHMAEYGNMARQEKEKSLHDEELKRQVRVLEEQLDALESDMRRQREDFDKQRRQANEDAESQMNRQVQRLKEDHEFELNQLRSAMDRDKEEMDFKLKRESENTRAMVEREWEIKQRNALDDMKRKYEAEITDLQTDTQREIEKIERGQKDKISEIMQKLQNSEAALLSSKQSYFDERERLQETIDSLHEEIRTLKHQLSDKEAEIDRARREFDLKQDSFNAEVDRYERQLKEMQRDLEDKTIDIQRVTDRLTGEIAEQKLSYDKKIADLQNQVTEYQSLAAELEAIEKEFNVKLRDKEQEVENLVQQLRDERMRAQEAVDESKEAQAYASDQLQRVQRLLEEAERDIDRYRRLSDEKDTEVLDLKRALRQKDKELSSMMAGGDMDSSSSMRRLLDQKDRDLETARSEIRAAMADIAALKRRVEMKDREIEDAKNEMTRRTKMKHKDEAMEEVDRLQLIILELKTARVGLLEDLDNAQHNEQILRTEVNSLKNEVERVIYLRDNILGEISGFTY